MIAATTEQKKAIWRKKLLVRAQRRGFKELDLVIGAFAEDALEGMSEAELLQFEQIMNVPDQEMLVWLLGVKTPDIDAPVLDRLRAFCALWKKQENEARL